jgi:UDP-2-acetamido-3-amino-2,3-dideoxy-glucuronate N-acetyltransferase
MEYIAHESSQIDISSEIGKNSEIGAFCLLNEHCKVGHDCSIGNYVRIAEDVQVGNHVIVSDNVSLYKGVEVADGVFIGPSTVFVNILNPRAEQKEEYKNVKPTLLKKGCTTGANSTILSGITLGEYCFIGAGAVVLEDVSPYSLMVGAPARRVGWMSRDGGRLHFGLEGKARCPASGKVYLLKNGVVRLIEE